MKSQHPWIQKVLKENWKLLEDTVGPLLMPVTEEWTTRDQLEKYRANKPIREFGCGLWGCVIPTKSKGLVLKITKDYSEAAFVSLILSKTIKGNLDGLVKYHTLFELPSVKKERVFAIWREEAIGFNILNNNKTINMAAKNYGDRYSWAKTRLEELRDSIEAYYAFADKIREYVEDLDGDARDAQVRARTQAMMDNQEAAFDLYVTGDPAFPECSDDDELLSACYFIACVVMAKGMAQNELGALIGKTILNLHKNKVILADVHLGNIGTAKRGTKHQFVITDPGYMTWLGARAPKINIMHLTERLFS